MKFRIRYNQSAGQPGRGSIDHKWRVFDENDKEYICKKVVIHKASMTEKDPNGDNWNIICVGTLELDREFSTIHII
jgi:hypothetical protein